MAAARRPESDFGRRLELVADLRLSVSDGRGEANAYLHGESDDLTLEIDCPEVVLRQLRPWSRSRRLPLRAVPHLVDNTAVEIRSADRRLGRLRVTPAGRLRIRPTWSGVQVVLRSLRP